MKLGNEITPTNFQSKSNITKNSVYDCVYFFYGRCLGKFQSLLASSVVNTKRTARCDVRFFFQFILWQLFSRCTWAFASILREGRKFSVLDIYTSYNTLLQYIFTA